VELEAQLAAVLAKEAEEDDRDETLATTLEGQLEAEEEVARAGAVAPHTRAHACPHDHRSSLWALKLCARAAHHHRNARTHRPAAFAEEQFEEAERLRKEKERLEAEAAEREAKQRELAARHEAELWKAKAALLEREQSSQTHRDEREAEGRRRRQKEDVKKKSAREKLDHGKSLVINSRSGGPDTMPDWGAAIEMLRSASQLADQVSGWTGFKLQVRELGLREEFHLLSNI
jgi:hypothetical protein